MSDTIRWGMIPLVPLLIATPAFGQASIVEQAQECTGISDSLARLVCFDALFTAESGDDESTPEPSFNAEGYRLDLFNTGGILPRVSVDSNRNANIDLFSTQALSGLDYVVRLVLGGGYHEQVSYGTINAMAPHSAIPIADPKLNSSDPSRFEICTSFTNASTGNRHVVVSFLEEQQSSVSGQATYAFAEEYAAPISLITNETFSCDNALTPWLLESLSHRDRFAGAQNPSSEEHAIDGTLLSSAIELMTGSTGSDGLFYDMGIIAHRHLADVESTMVVEPIVWSGDTLFVKSNVAYMASGTYLEPFEMQGPDVINGELPWKEVRFNACSTYFVVEEQRYLKETWSREYSLAELKASPTEGGAIYPEEIFWTESGTPMSC